MRILAKLVPVVLLVLSASALTPATAASGDWRYSVRPGDNLWNLSQRYLTSVGYFRRLQKLNGITDPVHIPPGTVIRIPMRWLRVAPATATVVKVHGDARLESASGGSRALTVGAVVALGDRLVTGAGGNATVRFADGSRLLVREASEVGFDTMSAYSTTGMVDTRLRLQGGRVESEVRPARGPGSRYEVITPPAVAAVRGTRFRVAMDAGQGLALSEVVRGVVGFRGKGVRRRLDAGFGATVRTGQPPSPPVALLAAPDLSALAPRAERLLLAFSWPPLAGAVGYRAQLYPAGRPDALLLDKRVGAARVEWNAPPDGDYLLRVRGVDGNGLEGLDGEHSFTLDARPVPPTLLGPTPGQRIHGSPPEFWWSMPDGTRSFHLQVAADADFSKLLIDRDHLAQTRLRAEREPPPGTYHWRMASRDASGARGPWGDPASFRVLAVPSAPGPGSAGVAEREIRFRWPSAADAVEYDFEFASDKQFKERLVERRLGATETTVEKPGSGSYYFRTRGISGEGVVGPYGPVNRLEVPAKPLPAWLAILVLPLILLL